MTPFATASGGSLEYSRRMGRYVWLVVLAVGMGVVVACGSGGGPVDQQGEPVSTETPRSERAEREATIMQQQQAQQAQQDEAEVVQAEAPSAEEPIAGVTEVGEIDYGHREGLPYLRNSVGDPDAPVVIVEYSDFQ